MAGRCSAPRSTAVKGHTRSKPRRRATRAVPAVYYECFNRSGHGCGVHHATRTAAYRHAQALNRQVRRRSLKTRDGRQDLYDYRKLGG